MWAKNTGLSVVVLIPKTYSTMANTANTIEMDPGMVVIGWIANS
jgi:hypothetical protein